MRQNATLHSPALDRLVIVAQSNFCEVMNVNAQAVLSVDLRLGGSNAKIYQLASDTRKMAVYLLHTGLGYSLVELAEACGTSKQNIHRMIKSVEEERTSRATDRILCAVEQIWGVNS
jgi:hypothetical protein